MKKSLIIFIVLSIILLAIFLFIRNLIPLYDSIESDIELPEQNYKNIDLGFYGKSIVILNDRIFISGDDRLSEYNLNMDLVNNFEYNFESSALAVNGSQAVVAFYTYIEKLDLNTGLSTLIFDSGPNSYISSIIVINEKIVASDSLNKVIYVLNIDGKLEKIISESERGDFIVPGLNFDLGYGQNDSFWLVHTGTRKLLNYDIDGNLLSSWGESSNKIDSFPGCCNPLHIALTEDGNFITYEKGTFYVKIYSDEGKFKQHLFTLSEKNKVVEDMAVDINRNIYLLIDNQILIYEHEG